VRTSHTMARRSPVTTCRVCASDASGEEGWAAWTFTSGVVYMVSGVWGELDRDLIIADKELVASTIGLFVLGEALQFHYVWEYTDNTVALSAIRSLTPSTPLSQRLCAARVIWCSDRSVFVMGERITSANNEWADIGSRPVTRLQMFHVADAGSSYKGGPEALGQSIFERGLRTISNDAAARQQLVDLVAMLEEGLADAGARHDADGSEPPSLAMALRALVRQTTKAKPKAALQWWRDARRAYPRFSPQPSSRWTKVDSLVPRLPSTQPLHVKYTQQPLHIPRGWLILGSPLGNDT
jgi:hypothetical protein